MASTRAARTGRVGGGASCHTYSTSAGVILRGSTRGHEAGEAAAAEVEAVADAMVFRGMIQG